MRLTSGRAVHALTRLCPELFPLQTQSRVGLANCLRATPRIGYAITTTWLDSICFWFRFVLLPNGKENKMQQKQQQQRKRVNRLQFCLFFWHFNDQFKNKFRCQQKQSGQAEKQRKRRMVGREREEGRGGTNRLAKWRSQNHARFGYLCINNLIDQAALPHPPWGVTSPLIVSKSLAEILRKPCRSFPAPAVFGQNSSNDLLWLVVTCSHTLASLLFGFYFRPAMCCGKWQTQLAQCASLLPPAKAFRHAPTKVNTTNKA